MIQETITLLIFGASGDLTHRKLVPALYSLYRKGRLPAGVHIVGFSRTPYSHEDFRGRLRAAAREFAGDVFEAPLWDRFADRIWYVPGDLRYLEDYERLQAFLSEIEGNPVNRLYYLATAPDLYEPAVECLGAMRMAHSRHGWCRIVVEKPFGHDLPSAQSLNEHIHRVFDESQVYRIDHYLGKETAQNVLFSVSLTRFSSRCGTGATWTTCRSPSPKAWMWGVGGATTTEPVCCATWCRTTCCSC